MRLLTLINQAPYNEDILRNAENPHPFHGGTSTKYGRQKINHRGLILLQTSKSRVAHDVFDPETDKGIPRGAIVGVAVLTYCDEGMDGFDEPEFSYRLKGARRFFKPIPFVKPGPQRWHSVDVTSEIERELRRIGAWREAKKADRELSI